MFSNPMFGRMTSSTMVLIIKPNRMIGKYTLRELVGYRRAVWRFTTTRFGAELADDMAAYQRFQRRKLTFTFAIFYRPSVCLSSV